jgi:hypothetical protein
MARRLLKRTQSQALCGRLQRLVANILDSSQDTIFVTKLDALAITIEQTEVTNEINMGPYPLSKDFSQLLEHLWKYVSGGIFFPHPTLSRANSEKFKPWTDFRLHEIWHTGNIPFSPDVSRSMNKPYDHLTDEFASF